MKTRILLIAALIMSGVIFTYGQHVKEAVSQQPSELLVLKVNHPQDRLAPIGYSDLLTNYPDPFKDMTFIEYRVPQPTWVTLLVWNRAEMFVIPLVKEFQHEGVYRIEFDASELPPGTYIAQLKMGFISCKEVMTKVKKESTGEITKSR